MPDEKQLQRWFRRSVQVILLAVLAFAVWWFWPESVIEVRTVQAQRRTVEEYVSSTQAGSVKSNRRVTLRANSAGRVESLMVRHGDRVKVDQVLVELEAGSLRARLRLAQANLRVGESAMRSAVVRRDVSRRTLERSRQLADRGALAAGGLEKVQAEFDMAQESVSASEANLVQLQAAVDVSREAVEDTRVRAPFDGLVADVFIELGEMVSPALPLLDLMDDSRLTVEAPIDEADLGRIRSGMAVRITADAYRDHPFDGRLEYIAPVVLKDVRQNRHLNVEVALTNGAASKLNVGMSADIEIIVVRKEDALAVPTNAIMRRGDSNWVYILSGGRAKMVEVQTGLTNWENTEILSGLRVGDEVIVSLGAEGLRDGARVGLLGSAGSNQVAY